MQRLFRLGNALVIIVLAAQKLHAFDDALAVICAQPVAEQRIDREVEEVGKLHQHRNFRQALPLLPFAHCRDGDTHRFGELFLRQPLLFAVKADLFCNTVFHHGLLSRPSGRFFFCCEPSIAPGAAKGQ